MIIPGTTPTHVFTVPFKADIIEKLEIVYAQSGKAVVTKNIDACKISGNEISVTLTQEDTLSFEDEENIAIRVRVLTNEGEALASNIIHTYCGIRLSNEVL